MLLRCQDLSRDAVADFQADGSGSLPDATVLPKVPVSNSLLPLFMLLII